LAALDAGGTLPEALVVAGPAPLPYRDFATAVAAAACRKPPRFVAIPEGLLRRLAPLARPPLLPRIAPEQIQRLTEDQAFDVGPMRARLGVVGRPLAAGLAQAFRPA
jgi:nucleoside-diphosphate-sugar epimerase